MPERTYNYTDEQVEAIDEISDAANMQKSEVAGMVMQRGLYELDKVDSAQALTIDNGTDEHRTFLEWFSPIMTAVMATGGVALFVVSETTVAALMRPALLLMLIALAWAVAFALEPRVTEMVNSLNLALGIAEPEEE